MRRTNAISERRRGERGRHARDRFDQYCKRLLAAILELSLLQREQPRRRQPQVHERQTEEPRRHEGSSPRRLDRVMRAHGLGARHATALLSVALSGPMTVTQLATRHHVMVKTASLIAVELERAGLIERREDPADRRRTIVAIAKGKERAVEEGLNRRAAHLQRALDRLTSWQREGLITGLEALAEEMSRDRDQEADAEGAGGFAVAEPGDVDCRDRVAEVRPKRGDGVVDEMRLRSRLRLERLGVRDPVELVGRGQLGPAPCAALLADEGVA